MSTIKSSNKIVQKGYGLPLVFDIANRRYTYRAADDPRFLNLDSIATAKSAWVLRFKNKIDGFPQAYIVFSQTERPLDPIEYLADIDELYGIPDDELIKVAARSYIVDGYGEAHDTFCDRYMRRLEDMGAGTRDLRRNPGPLPQNYPKQHLHLPDYRKH